MKLMLIGIKHSGKTTIGRELSRRWGYSFFDGDDMLLQWIRQQYPAVTSLRSYFPTVGASCFYQQQSAMLDAFFASHPRDYVLAAGGGICESPLDIPPAVKCLLLEEDAGVLWQRVLRGGTPPFLEPGVDPELAFTQMVQRRLPLLRGLAHFTYHCHNQLVAHICDEIEEMLYARK